MMDYCLFRPDTQGGTLVASKLTVVSLLCALDAVSKKLL